MEAKMGGPQGIWTSGLSGREAEQGARPPSGSTWRPALCSGALISWQPPATKSREEGLVGTKLRTSSRGHSMKRQKGKPRLRAGIYFNWAIVPVPTHPPTTEAAPEPTRLQAVT